MIKKVVRVADIFKILKINFLQYKKIFFIFFNETLQVGVANGYTLGQCGFPQNNSLMNHPGWKVTFCYKSS